MTAIPTGQSFDDYLCRTNVPALTHGLHAADLIVPIGTGDYPASNLLRHEEPSSQPISIE